MNILELRRFNGTESYQANTCLYKILETEKQKYIAVQVKSDFPVQTLPDTECLNAHPILEIKLPLTYGLAPGTECFAANDEENSANLYYAEHMPIENPRIKVIDIINPDTLELEISGNITDLNFYDGSKPDTRIYIRGVFIKSSKSGSWEIF